ncbi:hypothetical protein, partial [Prevotella pectinovora]|uniref:hypothetical protein n=1 Tax=Prevotella pectinovora TaxID=1602169 RepID=UPI003A91C7B4
FLHKYYLDSVYIFVCHKNKFIVHGKIMQGESRTSSLLECYAEPQLILCKDNARRMHNEINGFISYAKPQLILCKDK